MNTILITKDGQTFHNPSQETLDSTSFGILWGAGMKIHQVVSQHIWSVVEIGPYYLLKDVSGEVRKISWHTYHPAIEFRAWELYDRHCQGLELKDLKQQLKDWKESAQNAKDRVQRLEETLIEINRINSQGGPGSRANVKIMIQSCFAFPVG